MTALGLMPDEDQDQRKRKLPQKPSDFIFPEGLGKQEGDQRRVHTA